MTVPLPDPNTEDCRALSSILARVGDKWTVLIVVLLGDGPKRFNEIKRMVGGISQRMLTFTLRGLERDGLVKRTVFPTTPPRVDYELTGLGGTLWQAVEPLSLWARAHVGEILTSREQFDGSSLTPVWPSIAAIRPAHATLLIPGFVQRRSTMGAAAADVPETEAASGGSEGRRWVLLLDPPKSSPMTGIGATPPLAHET